MVLKSCGTQDAKEIAGAVNANNVVLSNVLSRTNETIRSIEETLSSVLLATSTIQSKLGKLEKKIEKLEYANARYSRKK